MSAKAADRPPYLEITSPGLDENGRYIFHLAPHRHETPSGKPGGAEILHVVERISYSRNEPNLITIAAAGSSDRGVGSNP